ncbi:MAG: DUF4886 domain-containing protein [Clostridia bacterium]|nr:DUF4886 domain-containing protein [Clostridia bacterium]
MYSKKFLLTVSLFLAIVLLFSSCSGTYFKTENNTKTQESENSPTQTETKPCTHSYSKIGTTPAKPLRDGAIDFSCMNCGHTYSEPIPATKTVRVLALGNSFTVDGMHYLWDICKNGGAETVILGNLYIGNCTLDKHWGNISGNKAAYKFYKNTDGNWTTTENYRVLDAIKEEDWDLFVFHQAGAGVGFVNTFANFDHIIDFFNQNKTNPNAKMMWHLTWAYQGNSKQEAFAKYDYDQMKMYTAATTVVKEYIAPKETIAGVIPTGTAIQNLRTSHFGDTVTRDTYHLSYNYGRYTAALTWYAALTGGDVDAIDWIPKQYPGVNSFLPLFKECVNNAMKNPYQITQSSFTKR